ncbi:MAG: hypothetical protein CVV44_10885 [Spirochaetae bacterium HGW-Spirochaetae-1]|jgi:hypothetical protein|nr:MAG: hypothetical protein CVV44_10885 [Spirochaetae bacterium HGW-Spirochaetae-1]
MKHYLKAIVPVLVIAAVTVVSGRAIEEKKTYKIGDRGPAGGFIFFDRGIDTRAIDLKRWRYLEAAPIDQSADAAWSEGSTGVTGATGTELGAGAANTSKILQVHGSSAHAAKVCADYKGGGITDWYLPSKKELSLLYTNLKKKGIGGFSDNEYWSSSESDEAYAWYQGFEDGAVDNNAKTNHLRVRAVRAFREE